MTFQSFLKLIRIETNLTSALPALLGFLFACHHFHTFNVLNAILFFAALMCVSSFVTAWNSVMDYHKALDEEYRNTHNQLVVFKIPLKTAYIVCFVLMFLSLVLGGVLITLTNWLLLLLGGLCILVTIFYTFSPFAFSRMPLGEILAGGVEGVGSFFLAVWVNAYHHEFLMLDWDITSGIFTLHGNLWTFLLVVFSGLSVGVFNFNIMLADNICDLEQDKKNGRYTLPYYIGKTNALKLVRYMYFLPFLLIGFNVILGVLPVWCVLSFLSFSILKKNVSLFNQTQTKEDTFHNIIQNLPVFEGLWLLGFLLSLVF